jgi:hypothetical protein
MAVDTHPVDVVETEPALAESEALFKEAKRRELRRRIRAASVGIVALVVVAVTVYVATSGSNPHAPLPQTTTAPPKPRTASPPSVGVRLKSPGAMAVGADGSLYVVDAARDQVISRTVGGKFTVVAGNGHRGFSGDGGAATEAELSLSQYSGVVSAPNGILYIADSGNDRVRAVSPNGTITTVAGDGSVGTLLSTEPALTAAIGGVSGLALGPDGNLYIAASNVVQLTPQGQLQWVAGSRASFPPCGFMCNPATQLDFSDPDQLAFDGNGDLYVSGFDANGLYEMTSGGSLLYLGQLRGDGAPGALAAAPDGSVVEAWRDGVSMRTATGSTTPVSSHADQALDSSLGRCCHDRYANVFIGGDGVAVAPDGDIFLDTNAGNSFTSVSALVRLTPSGRVSVLWKS